MKQCNSEEIYFANTRTHTITPSPNAWNLKVRITNLLDMTFKMEVAVGVVTLKKTSIAASIVSAKHRSDFVVRHLYM